MTNEMTNQEYALTELRKLQDQWDEMTKYLKSMCNSNPLYGQVWDERIEVGEEIKELKADAGIE